MRILSALFGSSNDDKGEGTTQSDYDGRDTVVYPPHPSDPRPYTAISSRREGKPMTISTTAIEITQDYEFDEDFGLGSPMLSFWAHGHGHDPKRFIRVVIDYTLTEHGSVPRIEPEDAPVEMWQRTIDRHDGVEYSRTLAESDDAHGREAAPVTVLDLGRRRRGGTKCSVTGCDKSWSSGKPAIVRIEADNAGPTLGGVRYMSVRMWFCREHTLLFPEPSYRVCMVPVGATILLPTTDDSGRV